MSFTHIANFAWAQAPTADEVDRISEQLLALADSLDGIESYRCGPDVSRTPNSFDYAIVAVFASAADYLVYRDHPEHQRIRDELISPIVDKRVLVQLDG